MGIQTENDTAIAFTKGELSEAKTKELLPTGKRFYEAITVVRIDALLKGVTRENARDLSEDVGTGVHAKSGEVWSDHPLPN